MKSEEVRSKNDKLLMKLVVFGGDGRDRGGKPLAFASQIPDYMSLVLACGEPHEMD